MRTIRAVLLGALLSLTLAAQAQYSNEPYFDDPDALRHAHALDLIEVRLAAMDAVAVRGDLPEELAEQAQSIVDEDLPRIAGSLQQATPDLYADFEQAAAELAEAAESGDIEAMRPAAQQVAELVMAARDQLFNEGELSEPPLAAAAMSRLLLGEPGVGEGYEEAVAGERWEYTLGWAALQRVEEIWADLAPQVAGRSDEVDEAVAELDELLPGPIPPESLSGDPEAGEEPSHRITSLLEGIADANLYPERELGRVAALGAELAATACAAYESGNDVLGMEYTRAAGFGFESISGTVAMLASEANERVEQALTSLTGVSDDDDEAEGEPAAQPAAEPAAACAHLQQGLEEIAELFGA